MRVFLTIFLCISLIPSGITKADGNVRMRPIDFYLLTRQVNQRRVWSLYHIDAISANSQHMVDFLEPAQGMDSLSLNELNFVQQGIHENLIPNDWLTAKIVNRDVDRIWQLDAETLIVESRLQFCEPISRAVCFGEFQFAQFDIEHGTLQPSFFTLDFHDERLRTDTVCNSISDVAQTGVVSINPIRKMMIVTVHGSSTVCGSPDKWVTLLIDFSSNSVSQRDFKAVTSSAWSPDGSQLVLVQRENCTATLCNVVLKVHSLTTGNTTLLHTISDFPLTTPTAIAWKDNTTIVYQSVYLCPDGYKPLLVERNMTTGAEVKHRMQPPSAHQYFSFPDLLLAKSAWTQRIYGFDWKSYNQILNYANVSLVLGVSRTPFSIAMMQDQDIVAIYERDGKVRELRVNPSHLIGASEMFIHATSPELASE